MYAGLLHDSFHNGFADSSRTNRLKGDANIKKIYVMEKKEVLMGAVNP